jgi:DNA polymerase-3 subunit delta'
MFQTFSWHNDIVGRLAELAQQQKLPAAVALTCGDGWGGHTLLARCAAELLKITSELPPDQVAHPDFCWIQPDGAVIKIDPIRRLNQFAVQTPQISKRKVAGIVDAHLMNKNAANALLKILEEPPRNTHILLVTPYWGRLPATIRSRCQQFTVAKDSKLAAQWLEHQGITFRDTDLLEAGGAPLNLLAAQDFDLRSWLDELDGAQDPNACVAALLKADVVDVLARWSRTLLAGQKLAVDRQTLAFIAEVNQVRITLQSSNSANAQAVG